jgi:hypothetical protein
MLIKFVVWEGYPGTGGASQHRMDSRPQGHSNSMLCHYAGPKCFGEVSERFKEAVLKTVVVHATVGSNPTLSVDK